MDGDTPARVTDPITDLHARIRRIRAEMGGAERVARMRADGVPTVRDHLTALLDEGSFRELGTFSRSMRLEDRANTPGDGKVGGEGTIGGRPVAIAGDDITVKKGSSAVVGGRKLQRLFDRALERGMPYVYIGETGGGRIPDIIGSEGVAEAQNFDVARRRRRIPMATMIVGQSFGGSSFEAAYSDFVVQVRGSVLAVTSPRVFEIATGEVISFEELGGVDVHARVTGQIDLGVETFDEGYAAVRKWLSLLPPNAWSPAPRGDSRADMESDPSLAALVPAARTRGYDMRRFCAALLDDDSFLELQPLYARNLTTGLGRLDGFTVGVIANNPMFSAGVLDPDACRKGIRLMTLCDAFDIPVIFLMDVPGFMVGRAVEHDRILALAIRFVEALANMTAPTLTVTLRKGFGLAFPAMNGSGLGSSGLYSWPGAEIGFMDPDVGVNVAFAARLAELDPEAAAAERQRLVEEISEATSPYEAAGTLKIDEVIDPADTRRVLVDDLRQLEGRRVPPPEQRPLSYWPTV
jgi:acetyl-CoA carboxylase carboxyltransferase component